MNREIFGAWTDMLDDYTIELTIVTASTAHTKILITMPSSS